MSIAPAFLQYVLRFPLIIWSFLSFFPSPLHEITIVTSVDVESNISSQYILPPPQLSTGAWGVRVCPSMVGGLVRSNREPCDGRINFK